MQPTFQACAAGKGSRTHLLKSGGKHQLARDVRFCKSRRTDIFNGLGQRERAACKAYVFRIDILAEGAVANAFQAAVGSERQR